MVYRVLFFEMELFSQFDQKKKHNLANTTKESKQLFSTFLNKLKNTFWVRFQLAAVSCCEETRAGQERDPEQDSHAALGPGTAGRAQIAHEVETHPRFFWHLLCGWDDKQWPPSSLRRATLCTPFFSFYLLLFGWRSGLWPRETQAMNGGAVGVRSLKLGAICSQPPPRCSIGTFHSAIGAILASLSKESVHIQERKERALGKKEHFLCHFHTML